jgi:hypothetical protein
MVQDGVADIALPSGSATFAKCQWKRISARKLIKFTTFLHSAHRYNSTTANAHTNLPTKFPAHPMIADDLNAQCLALAR